MELAFAFIECLLFNNHLPMYYVFEILVSKVKEIIIPNFTEKLRLQ